MCGKEKRRAKIRGRRKGKIKASFFLKKDPSIALCWHVVFSHASASAFAHGGPFVYVLTQCPPNWLLIGLLKPTGVFYLAYTVFFFKVEPAFKTREFLIKV